MWAASLLVVALPLSGDDPLANLLEKALRPTGFDVTATVLQRDFHGDGSHRMVRVVRDKKGRMASLVLSPAEEEGMASLDDGTRMRMYVPSTGQLVEGPSMTDSVADSAARIARAVKNYTLVKLGMVRVAGRDAMIVAARPRDSRMPERRYALDRANGYPLRLEMMAGGQTMEVFEVRSIAYGKRFPKDAFVLKTKGPVRVESLPTPRRVTLAQATAAVGFRPVMPKKLPMGFAVEGMMTTMAGARRMLAIRLTDGLARATVYQVLDHKGAAAPGSVLAGRVRLLIGTDLPPAHRDALLKTFAQAAELAEIPPVADRCGS